MSLEFVAKRAPSTAAPILAQVLGAVGSSALGFGMLALEAPRAWGMVSALPMLGALVWIATRGNGRPSRIRASKTELRVLGSPERIYRIDGVTVLRWIEPHTGRRLGDVFEFESGAGRVRLGVPTKIASAEDERALRLDYFVPEEAASAFADLYARPKRASSGAARFRLIPLASPARTLLGIAPFVGGSLAVALLLTAIDQAWPNRVPALARGCIAGVAVVALLVGTFRRFSRAKNEWILAFEPNDVVVRDEQGASQRTLGLADLCWGEGLYSYHTKYGSHRVSVVTLHGAEGAIRVGVWEDASASARASKAKRPEYLVEGAEYARLLSTLRERRLRRE